MLFSLNLSVLDPPTLKLVSRFSHLWSEKMLGMISIFLNELRLVLCPIMWSIFENVPCELKIMCILLLWDERLYVYQLSPFHFKALFNGTVSLLIYCLEDLSIFDSGVLKSPTIIVLLSVSFWKSSKIFFIMWVLLC